MNFSFDLHLGYALMVVLGFALTLTFPLTRHYQDCIAACWSCAQSGAATTPSSFRISR